MQFQNKCILSIDCFNRNNGMVINNVSSFNLQKSRDSELQSIQFTLNKQTKVSNRLNVSKM